jgi:hypothetical protein
MLFTASILSVLIAVAVAEPVPAALKRCDVIHPKAVLTNKYWEAIAHAIHSMDLDSLKKFQPNANERTAVPTVNLNLHNGPKVLDYAPQLEKPSLDFATDSMALVDTILTRVGKSDDGLGPNWTPLERVVHNFHMRDLWAKIKPVFDEIEVEPATCKCLTSDLTANGIRPAVEWIANHYARGTPITLLNRPIPVLNDHKTWTIWRERLIHYYTPTAIHDAAYFLKCL